MFELGKVYVRRDVHAQYGGQRQQGISTPADGPYVFLITGEGGKGAGYADKRLEDGTFLYYGEGDQGDMQWNHSNASVRDHAANGKDLHLFEKVPPRSVRYLGEYVCSGYRYVPNALDSQGNKRTAIAFQLVPLRPDDADAALAEADAADLGDDELASAGQTPPAENAPPHEAKRLVYKRSAAVRRTVLTRAGGSCEGCKAAAPFQTAKGEPYLEPHHIRRLSDGGPDDPRWVIALCPTCHRRVHHGADGATYNETLLSVASGF